MKFLIQFLIIVTFAFVGEVLHDIIPLPIPASIYGIILLFVFLQKKWIKVKDIRETSIFLIAIMPVMFIPAAAGLINSWAVIRPSLVQYIFITFFTTFLVMGAAGISTQYVIRRGKAKNNQVKQVVTEGKESAQ